MHSTSKGQGHPTKPSHLFLPYSPWFYGKDQGISLIGKQTNKQTKTSATLVFKSSLSGLNGEDNYSGKQVNIKK